MAQLKTTTVSGDLAVAGNALITGTVRATTFNAISDARLKENFEAINLKRNISSLPVYKYDFIYGPKGQIGCKAQDLQEICPEIVEEDENGYLSIQESKLVYLLLEEIKILNARIENLEKQINM